MINLRCNEPAGTVIQLSADDLTRHVLATGATGAGKTTGLINPLLRQIIAWPGGSRRRIGLVVLDAKEDDTVERVKAYARMAGREEDVMVLSSSCDSYYDFFGDFSRLSQLEDYTSRVLYGTRDLGDQNAYWTEYRFGLVQCALVLMLIGGPCDFRGATEFLQGFCFERNSQVVADRVSFAERLLGKRSLRPASRRRLELAVAEAKNWRSLDDRTRELHRSILGNTLRPLFSPAASELFDRARRIKFDPSAATAGRILVCSVNGVKNPQFASLLFRVLKRDFYTAVTSRTTAHPDRDRLCGLVLDELPLAVTPEDPEVLAILRSKGGFLVAATQSMAALDEVIGRRRRDVMMSNFNTFFFFGGREPQTDEFAAVTIGVQPGTRQAQLRLACPPGTLSRLRQHEAYVKTTSEVSEGSVWLDPLFHDFKPAPMLIEKDDLAEIAEKLRREETDNVTVNPSCLVTHMRQSGFRPMTSPSIVAAAWQLCTPRTSSRAGLLRYAASRYQIEGLGQLPSCWLLGLLRWLEHSPDFGRCIVRIRHQSGVLWPELNLPSAWLADGPMVLPMLLNLWIYPSLWKPLKHSHRLRLRVDRPDLRLELESLPGVSEYQDNPDEDADPF